MPKNNNLKPVKLPMKLRFKEEQTTEFKNNLDSIKVTLVDAPTIEQLREYIPGFITATWSDSPNELGKEMSIKEKDDAIKECFEGKALPTALETIGLTFTIEGISLQEVTHILRHRTASFSAECSGDKWWTHKAALIPNSIENSNGHKFDQSRSYNYSEDFHARYRKIVQESKKLYCDMIDSKQISIMDARYILPRCLETFYYMRIPLKDAINFIKQRIDKQIQPETDNIIAYYMYIELLSKYKHLVSDLIDIHQPSNFYIKTARTGKATNLYFPDKDSDKFEYNEKDFIYQCTRDKMNGTDIASTNKFNKILAYIEMDILVKKAKAKIQKI